MDIFAQMIRDMFGIKLPDGTYPNIARQAKTNKYGSVSKKSVRKTY